MAEETKPAEVEPTLENPKSKKRLYELLLVSILLIVALVFGYFGLLKNEESGQANEGVRGEEVSLEEQYEINERGLYTQDTFDEEVNSVEMQTFIDELAKYEMGTIEYEQALSNVIDACKLKQDIACIDEYIEKAKTEGLILVELGGYLAKKAVFDDQLDTDAADQVQKVIVEFTEANELGDLTEGLD